jgi:hypothetical protein
MYQNGSSVLNFNQHHARLNEFKVLDDRLIVDDIEVMNGTDIYILAKGCPYLNYFKLDSNSGRANFISRI